jgi:nucleoside 2-deoxyribosyltransferase
METNILPRAQVSLMAPLAHNPCGHMLSRIEVIYIAGPLRGPSAWELEQHTRAAEALALQVWLSGMAALCSHANIRFFQGAAAAEVFRQGDFELIRRCDALLTVSGWERDPRTSREMQLAHSLGKPVFHSMFDLVRWKDLRECVELRAG